MMMQRSLLLLLVGAAAAEVVYFPIEATITFPEMAGKPSGTIKLSQASAADYMTRNVVMPVSVFTVNKELSSPT